MLGRFGGFLAVEREWYPAYTEQHLALSTGSLLPKQELRFTNAALIKAVKEALSDKSPLPAWVVHSDLSLGTPQDNGVEGGEKGVGGRNNERGGHSGQW